MKLNSSIRLKRFHSVGRADNQRTSRLTGAMTRSSDPGGVPHSSGRNRFATKKTLTLILVVVGFLLVAVMVPW